MTNEALPWLGFPPAVDLANTVMVTPAGELDLLEDEGQLRAWIAAERGRIAGVEAASVSSFTRARTASPLRRQRGSASTRSVPLCPSGPC